MLETTLVSLQDIMLDKILDEAGRKILLSEFPKIMQQVRLLTFGVRISKFWVPQLKHHQHFSMRLQAVTKTFSPCATWKLNLLSLLSCLYFSLWREFLRSVFNGMQWRTIFSYVLRVCVCAGICLFTSGDMCIEHGEASVLWASHCMESSRWQRFLSLPVFHVPELVFCLREKLIF